MLIIINLRMRAVQAWSWSPSYRITCTVEYTEEHASPDQTANAANVHADPGFAVAFEIRVLFLDCASHITVTSSKVKKKKKRKYKGRYEKQLARVRQDVRRQYYVRGNLIYEKKRERRCVRKRNLWHVRLTKPQIRPRIRAVWLEPSLSAWRNFVSLVIQNASNEDSDQTVRMRSLIWIFAGRTCPKVRNLTLQVKWFSYPDNISYYFCFVFVCFFTVLWYIQYLCFRRCDIKRDFCYIYEETW